MSSQAVSVWQRSQRPHRPAAVRAPSNEGTSPFTDVPAGHFAFNDLRCLLELGITRATDESYRPDDEMTRAEMAAFMARTHIIVVLGGAGTILDLSWSAVPSNASNGGGPITGHRVEYRVNAPRKAAEAFAIANQPNNGWKILEFDEDTGVLDFPPNVTTGTAKGLVKNNTYLFRVRAVTDYVLGSSGYSIASVVQGVPVVERNSQHTATDIADRDITLDPHVAHDETDPSVLNVTWTSLAATDESTITGYKVRWFPSAFDRPRGTGSADVPGKTIDRYVITGLAPDTYTVVVSAVNAIGQSVAIIAHSVVTADDSDDNPDTIDVPEPEDPSEEE